MAAESAFVLNESGKLLVEPYIEELPELFVSYFKEILQVGYEIPRLEYFMSHGKRQKIVFFFSIEKDFSKRNKLNSVSCLCHKPKQNLAFGQYPQILINLDFCMLSTKAILI